jgi:hypothetical protein
MNNQFPKVDLNEIRQKICIIFRHANCSVPSPMFPLFAAKYLPKNARIIFEENKQNCGHKFNWSEMD